jgi:hypothetical protein
MSTKKKLLKKIRDIINNERTHVICFGAWMIISTILIGIGLKNSCTTPNIELSSDVTMGPTSLIEVGTTTTAVSTTGSSTTSPHKETTSSTTSTTVDTDVTTVVTEPVIPVPVEEETEPPQTVPVSEPETQPVTQEEEKQSETEPTTEITTQPETEPITDNTDNTEDSVISEEPPVVEETTEEVIIPPSRPYIYDCTLSEDLQNYIYNNCQTYGVQYEFVMAIMACESGFNIYASNGSCYGLMQLHTYYNQGKADSLGVSLYDGYGNALVGIVTVADLLSRYSMTDALICYNYGEYGAIGYLGGSTSYSRTVMSKYYEYIGY